MLTFDKYWADPRYLAKRPFRNGSRVVMMGDNIYHRKTPGSEWIQEDSHHSRPNGSPDPSNIKNDTGINKVLASTRFAYFGAEAPDVPQAIFDEIGYRNLRNHRTINAGDARALLQWFDEWSQGKSGEVMGDPFQFRESAARYSAKSNKIIK